MATVLESFYSTPRAGVFRLSDGGGPFGFDITVAYQVDHAIRVGKIDGIVESGCFVGDTTEYLARRYPELPIVGIEVSDEYASIAEHRLREHTNVRIVCADSAVELGVASARFTRPFVYLDAHWGPEWPLRKELAMIDRGIVAVDDFHLEDARFGCDAYDGLRLDHRLLSTFRPDLTWYVGDPFAEYPHPCLQIGRRTGTAFADAGPNLGIFESSYFRPAPALAGSVAAQAEALA